MNWLVAEVVVATVCFLVGVFLGARYWKSWLAGDRSARWPVLLSGELSGLPLFFVLLRLVFPDFSLATRIILTLLSAVLSAWLLARWMSRIGPGPGEEPSDRK